MKFEFQNIKWGLSEKKDGNMSLWIDGFSRENLENRRKFFEKNKIDINDIVSAGLSHGNNIALVSNENKERIVPDTDGLATDEKNVFLAITVADCIPIYFYDKEKNAIGLAHSGWRGVAKNISGKMIKAMIKNFNSDPKNIIVYIGPHIQKCHFEVKSDVSSKFDEKYIIREKNKEKINLLLAVKDQLVESGIFAENINSSDECTFCNREKYFSFRRDKPEKIQSMIAYIGIV